MDRLSQENIDISSRGKTIRTLIKELQTFENLDAEVRMSYDCGDSSRSIGLVGRIDGCCVLMNCEE